VRALPNLLLRLVGLRMAPEVVYIEEESFSTSDVQICTRSVQILYRCFCICACCPCTDPPASLHILLCASVECHSDGTLLLVKDTFVNIHTGIRDRPVWLKPDVPLIFVPKKKVLSM
jgi:hypothetical protein